jgi:hypothetical protein
MDRRRWTVFRGTSCFLIIVVCASIVSVSPVRAVGPAAEIADGIWTVQGRAIHGTRRCGDWLVRLTNARGQLSGVVSLARSSVPIQNLMLQPDGTFSGTTRAGLTGSRHARAYKVTGKFSGDTVSLTLKDSMCPPRSGTAIRQAGGA